MAENTTIKIDSTDDNTNSTIRDSGLLTVGAIGAAVAAVVNGAIFGVARAADVPMVVMDGGTENTVNLAASAGMSVISFAVGLVGAVLAYRFFGRRSLRPMAVVGLVLALASNVTFPEAEATAATKWTLAAMHVVVGVTYLASLEVVRSRIPGTSRAVSRSGAVATA